MKKAVIALALLGACGADEPGRVRIQTRDVNGIPVGGVTVYGHDAAGVRLGEQVTDIDGVAELDVPAGGSVTTHDHPTTAPTDTVTDRWYTVLGVEPGDDLAIPIARRTVAEPTATITLPPLPPGSTYALIGAGCARSSNRSATVGLSLDPRCPSAVTLVAKATDDNGRPRAYLVVENVDLTQGAVTVPGSWRGPAGTLAVHLTGLPASGGQAYLRREAVIGGYEVYTDGGSITTTTPTVSFTTPQAGIGERAVYEMTVMDESPPCVRRDRALTRSQQDLDHISVDLADLPPLLDGVVVSDHRLEWSGGTGTGASTATLAVHLASGYDQTWTVVVPPGMRSVTYPADVGFTWPEGPAAVGALSGVNIVERTTTRWSYAQSRRHHDTEPVPVDDDFVERRSRISVGYNGQGCPSS